MTTVELERVTNHDTDEQEHEEDHPRECHLYPGFDLTSLCGISHERDPHNGIHDNESFPWRRGLTACPGCGAPICVECLLKAS